jgi:hypothetical protein
LNGVQDLTLTMAVSAEVIGDSSIGTHSPMIVVARLRPARQL